MTTTQIVQLPPDGVGKKIRHRLVNDLIVTTGAGGTPPVGTRVKGSVSLATGYISGTYSSSTDTTYYITDVTSAFTTSDTIVDYTNASIVYASAVASVNSNVYVSSSTISDPKTPEYVLSINKRGAAFTTFPEGTPQFDSFGHMQVSQMQAVGEYYAVQQDQPTYIPKWWTSTNATNGNTSPGVISGSATGYPVTAGAVVFQANTQGTGYGVSPVWRANTSSGGSFANVAFNPNLSVITMSVGTGTYDQSLRRTNQYHPNKPGVSQLIYLGVTASVTGANGPTAGTTADGTQATPGQNGVTREWGYFDRYNGFGFRLRDRVMYVFLRTSGNISASTGTTSSDIEVPQSLWNINTLQSSTTSDFLLDVTKENIYWMDMAWSAGQVIMGVVSPDGRRVQCHQFQFGNGTFLPAGAAANYGGQGLVPYMQTGTLPITLNIFNNGNATPGYGSALNWSWGVVFTESADLQYTGAQIHVYPLAGPLIITSNANSNVWSPTASLWSYGSYQPILSFTPKPMVNGLRNNQIGIHENFDFVSNGASSIHVGICVFYGNTAANLQQAGATGPNWGLSSCNWIAGTELVPQSLLRMDTSAVSMNQNYYTGTTAGGALTNYFMIESFIAPANSSIRYALGDRMYKSFWLPAFCDIKAGTGVNGTNNTDGVALDPNTYPIFTFACKALTPGINPGAFYTKYWKEIR